MKPYLALRTCVVLGVLTLLLLPRLATAQGNLVVNGGFDTDASGWTITNVSAGGGYQSSYGNPNGSIFLLDASSLNPPTASQEINSLTSGQLYVVSGQYQKGVGKDNGDNFGVALDGVTLFEITFPPDYAWHNFSFDYTATSTGALLSLFTQPTVNQTFDYYYIDNISMQAVPEPSSEILLALGGLGFLWYRHKAKAV
jgi:hypothetical protein